MGTNATKLEKVLSGFPETEKYFGLENFGNTCYCNSVLQALYFCVPFRQHCIQYLAAREKDRERQYGKEEREEHLLWCLADLFLQISSNRKRYGAIPPKKFVNKLRRENEVFRSPQHQDAHEFLNYLLNHVDELLQKEMKEEDEKRGDASTRSTTGVLPRTPDGDEEEEIPVEPDGTGAARGGIGLSRLSGRRSKGSLSSPGHPGSLHAGDHTPSSSTGAGAPDCVTPKRTPTEGGGGGKRKSFVHELFEGSLSSETRCLTCETVTSREETFLDLSIDVEQNISVNACLRNFSSSETLNRDDKFFCDYCCSLQEATKRIRIKKAPTVLAIHLKRFKYIEQYGRHKKLSYRVPFPFELRLPTIGDDDGDSLYNLFAVVIHVGSGPNMGHYVSMVKSDKEWLLFDDDEFEPIREKAVHSVFGLSQEFSGTTWTGYILFYSVNDCATKLDATAPGSARVPAHYYQA